jgi:hypothetical protein
MLSRAFWQTFWAMFMALIGSLGIGLAIVAGAKLAAGDYPSVVAAVVMAGACGYLCVLAEETRRETTSW